jgi:DNA-binding NarL/FixJ family response regulator
MVAPDADGPKLLGAILGVAQGASFLPEDSIARLRAIASGASPTRLDQQERMLLESIVDRRRDAEIGLKLGLTDRQVSAMVAGVLDKLL